VDYFAYLVNKYGTVPYEQMPDTYQSVYSEPLVRELIQTVSALTYEMKGIYEKGEHLTPETLRKRNLY